MRKTIMIIIISLFTPFLLLADDLSAIGYGLTKAEAEKNAYIELSKLISISVYNEEMVYEKDINGEINNSEFSIFSLQTTENTFLNTDKVFKIYKDNLGVENYICTVFLKESSSIYYIDLINDTCLKTIKYLENQYEEKKERISYEDSKNLIKAIIKNYQEYNTAKYVLVALNRFSSKIEKPKKTISIWQNEYNNILLKQKNDVSTNTNLSSDFAKQKIKEIDLELAKISLEAEIIKKNENKAYYVELEKKRKKIDNEVTNVLNDIIMMDTNRASSVINIDDSLKIFNEYFNQSSNIIKEYNRLREKIDNDYINEVENGIKELDERSYSIIDLDKSGKPLKIAKALRNQEILNFLSKKKGEYNINVNIINDKMIPIMNRIQNNLLTCLYNINNSSKYSIYIIPDDIVVNLNNVAQEYILDLTFYKDSNKEFSCSLKIPYKNFDNELNFDINNEQFNPNDEKQLNDYEKYQMSIEKYKKLLENKTFIKYCIDFRLTYHFINEINYELIIENRINNITLYRNDRSKNKLGYTQKHSNMVNFTKTFTGFLIPDELYENKYYSDEISRFYKNMKISQQENQSVQYKIDNLTKKILKTENQNDDYKNVNNEVQIKIDKLEERSEKNILKGLKANLNFVYLDNNQSNNMPSLILYGGLSYYSTMIHFFYFGAVADLTMNYYKANNNIDKDITAITFGILPEIGLFIPFKNKNGDKIKPFIGFQFGFSQNGFISNLIQGVEFPFPPNYLQSDKYIYNKINFKVKLQTSGENIGLLSISFGCDITDKNIFGF